MRLSEKVDKKVEVHYIWTDVIIRKQRDVADKINDDSGGIHSRYPNGSKAHQT